MNDIRSKVAYLQGLAEGLDLDTGSPEGRVLSSMLDLLVDIADEVTNITDAQNELAEYVEDVDYDLGALEETIYQEDDDEGVVQFIPSQHLMLEEDGVELTVCPECGETLSAAAGDIETELDVICPTCGCMVCEGYVDSPETVSD
ncbi:MAG TPA: AraC family transcriptional regulator [Symbiobacteriaceae bacterium]|nr:AraC family transcriptional regulator [Symbiobacteriaceae bacterium]